MVREGKTIREDEGGEMRGGGNTRVYYGKNISYLGS